MPSTEKFMVLWGGCCSEETVCLDRVVLEKSVSQFSLSVASNSLWPHPCLSPTPEACSNSCPSGQWCHPTISSSVVPFSCPQSFPASESFPMSQFFASFGQSIGASASTSVLPMNMQDRFALGLTGLTSLQAKGLSRIFSNATVQKHQFFGVQLSLWSNSHWKNHSFDFDLFQESNVSAF